MNWDHIAEQISSTTGTVFTVSEQKSVGGGSINDAYVIGNGKQRFFVKLNSAHQEAMFAAEAEGLNELNKPQTICVPRALCWGATSSFCYIVMQYIEEGRANAQSHRDFGEQLANMHRFTSQQFGWHRDNTIGSTAQPNKLHNDWIEFYREQRLGFQLELAARKGYKGRLQKDGETLLVNLETFFSNYSPSPSLLHGDLWSGNYCFDSDGNPVIFDPAVYYGDREADIAMTELFGGFSGDFYASYNEHHPLDDDYRVRKTLYNLYHIINHVNLFGSGYLSQAERMTSQLLSELR